MAYLPNGQQVAPAEAAAQAIWSGQAHFAPTLVLQWFTLLCLPDKQRHTPIISLSFLAGSRELGWQNLTDTQIDVLPCQDLDLFLPPHTH